MHEEAQQFPVLFTVGHSNHEIERFIALLVRHEITAVADVRSSPYSQYTPQFNREILRQALESRGIRYVFLGDELGARRQERECYVSRQARYDRIVELPAFEAGLQRLRKGATQHRIAMMCSEKDPLTCHRTILVCRALRGQGLRITHILENGALEPHDALEERLLATIGLPTQTLFQDKAQLIEQAYDKQAEAIAYTEQAEAADIAEAARFP